MKYENTYLVFDVTKGPKTIIETLNAYGDEGWLCSSMLNIAGTNIVAFLTRALEEPKTEEKPSKEEEKINKLWSGE